MIRKTNIRYLLKLLRLLFGLTFIFSGFFKMVDPVGTSLVIKEYLSAAHLSFLDFAALPGAFFLPMLEFVTGLCILFKLRMRQVSFVGLILTAFFTILTLILAIFNPIQDCGCFGEAIHLTNWQTFFKNIILMACIVPIFLYRENFRRVAAPFVEWIFICVYCLLSLSISLHSYFRMPLIEFGDFKIGTNIAVKLDEAMSNVEYKSLFIYEKEGESCEFTLENLPDSTWNYVETISELVGDDITPFDFHITDGQGEDITNVILNTNNPIFIDVITRLDKLDSPNRWKSLRSLADSIASYGGDFYLFTSASAQEVEMIVERESLYSFNFAYSDYKTLISLSRSNGGIVYLYDATVVQKWPKDKLKAQQIGDIINKDYEIITSESMIFQQVLYECLLVLVIFSLVLVRFISSLFYSCKKSDTE